MTTIVDDHPAIAEIKADLAEIEMGVLTSYTLADAIREGSAKTEQAVGTFRRDDAVCALSAGYLAAKARGYID